MATLRYRNRKSLAILALVLGCALGAVANDPVNIPPAELMRAEATYKDTFGAAHEKAKRAVKTAEKSEFAKRLNEAAVKSTNDPALQEVLRQNALLFAQLTDPVGLAVAVDVYKAYQPFPSRRALALDKIAAILERGLAKEPVATRQKLATDVIKGYRDAAVEYEKQGNASLATAAIGKARIVARKYTPGDRDIFPALDADERRLVAIAAEQSETERLKAFVAKNPDDVKSRIGLGTRFLRYTRIREAGEQFRAAGGEWIAVANALDTKPIDALALSQLLLKAQANLPPEDKKSRYAMMAYARGLLEDFRTGNADKWAGAVATYASVLEIAVATEPAPLAGQSVTPLVLAMIEWAEQLAGKFNYTEASNVLVRARTSSRTAKGPGEAKELQADLDSAERVVKACLALDTEISNWKVEEGKGALDAKGNLAYGVALLRAGRVPEAANRLAKSQAPAFAALAAILAKGDQTPALALGDSLRAAAGELQGNDKIDVQSLARAEYEKFLESNPKDGLEKTRIQLLAKELPQNTRTFVLRDYVELFDENPAFVQRMNFEGVSPGGGTVSAEAKDVFHGKLAMKVISKDIFANDLGWKYPIRENPKQPNEFRYAAFAWKKVGGSASIIQFVDAASPGEWRSYASGPYGNGTVKVTIRDTIPNAWTLEIRDLFQDHGAFTINGFRAWPIDGEYLLLDAIYLSKSKASLERLLQRK